MKKRLLAALAIIAACVAFDLSRPPQSQWSTRAFLTAINLYQATLSPLMPAMGVNCRFTPTCSHYGEESIRRHGALVGSVRACWRVLRCGPWTPAGTDDPP